MANTLQIKRSTTAATTPTLDVGELGVNLTDRKLWVGGNGAGNIALGGDGLFLKADGLPDAHTKLLIHSDTHDGSTTFTDSSGSGHTVTRSGAVHSTTQDKFGASSMYFDIDDYIEIDGTLSDFTFEGDFTIDLWLYRTVNTSGRHDNIMGGSGTGWRMLFNHISTHGLKLIFSGGGYSQDMNTYDNGSLNTWHHYAFTRASGTVRVFMDGVLKTTRTGRTETFTPQLVNSKLRIGDDGASSYDGPKGYIQAFRISKGIARWTANFTPPTRPYSYVDLNSNLNVAGYLEAPNIDGKPDSYTKLLIHSDTTDGRGTFTDSSPSGHAISTVSDPTHETEKSKFGASSIYFDGGDRLTVADHADWDFGSGDFTIDFWLNISSTSSSDVIGNRNNGSTQRGWLIYRAGSDSYLRFYASANGTSWNMISGTVIGTVVTNTWQHWAVTRIGNTFRYFVDGALTASETDTGTINNTSMPVSIGGQDGDVYEITGYMDEIRISKGIARWTAAFTPPTRPYATFSAGDGVFTGELLTPRLGVGAFNTGNVDYELNVEGAGRFSDGLVVVGTLTNSGNFNIAGAGTFNSGTGTSTFSSDVVPSVDNSKALGNASYRWSSLHAVTATLGGLLTGTTATFSGALSSGAITAPSIDATATGTSYFATNLSNTEDWLNSPISIRERGTASAGDGENRDAPNLNFHWAGRVSRSIWMESDGRFHIGEYSSAGVPNLTSGMSALNVGGLDINNTTLIDSSRNITGVGGTFSGALSGTTATFSSSLNVNATLTVIGSGEAAGLNLTRGNGNVFFTINDTATRFAHTEDSSDAANGHGGFEFSSNATATSSNELFKVSNASGQVFRIDNDKSASFSGALTGTSATFSGDMTVHKIVQSSNTGNSLYSTTLSRSGSGLTVPDIWDAGGTGIAIGHNSSTPMLKVKSYGVIVGGTIELTNGIKLSRTSQYENLISCEDSGGNQTLILLGNRAASGSTGTDVRIGGEQDRTTGNVFEVVQGSSTYFQIQSSGAATFFGNSITAGGGTLTGALVGTTATFSDALTASQLATTAGSTGTAVLKFGTYERLATALLGVDVTGGLDVSGKLTVGVSGTLSATFSGNVGIGTTAPDGLLHVTNTTYIDATTNTGTSSALIWRRLDKTIVGRIVSDTTNLKTQFWDNNSAVLTIGSDQVGIGTTSPTYNLDVSGTGRFTGELTTGVAPKLGGSGGITATGYVDGLLLVGSASSSVSQTAAVHFGDTSSGSARQWVIANGRSVAGATIGVLNIGLSSAWNADALVSGTNIVAISSTGLAVTGTGSFSGALTGTVAEFNSATDEKLVLSGSDDPFIRFEEGTTSKARIVWDKDSSNGSLIIYNDEGGKSITIAPHGLVSSGNIYHTGALRRYGGNNILSCNSPYSIELRPSDITTAYLSSTGFYPSPNGTIELGLTNNRWENVYSVAGNFSGALTATSATFSGNVEPNADNSSVLGSSTKRWSNVYGKLGNFSDDLTVAGWVTAGDVSTGTVALENFYFKSNTKAVSGLYGERGENLYTPNYMEKHLAYKTPYKFEYSNSDGSSWTEETVADNHVGIFNEGWYPAATYSWDQTNHKKIRFAFSSYGYRLHICHALRMSTKSNTITMTVEKSSTTDFSSGNTTVFTSTGMNGWPGLFQIVKAWHNSGQSAGLRITLESNQANTNTLTIYNIDFIGGYDFGAGGRLFTGYNKTTGRTMTLHQKTAVAGDLTPTTDGDYYLGTSSKQWKYGYFSNDVVAGGAGTFGGALTGTSATFSGALSSGAITATGAINSTGTGKSIQVSGVTRINSVGDIIGTSYYVGGNAVIDTSRNISAGTITGTTATFSGDVSVGDQLAVGATSAATYEKLFVKAGGSVTYSHASNRQGGIIATTGSGAFALDSNWVDNWHKIGGLFVSSEITNNYRNYGIVAIGQSNNGGAWGGSFSAEDIHASGTAYGVYIKKVTGNTRYGIYDASGAPWYTGGAVGIGTTAPGVKLQIANGDLSVYGGRIYISDGNNLNDWDIFYDTSLTGLSFSSTGAVSNAVFFKDDGNVGIGTTSPGAKLQIANGDLSVYGGRIYISDGSNLNDWDIFYDTSLTGLSFSSTGAVSNAVFFKDDGKVGIGTTAPAAKLDIAATDTFTTEATVNDLLTLRRTNGSSGSPSAAGQVASLWFNVTGNGGNNNGWAGIAAKQIASASNNTDLLFLTRGSAIAERMRITSDGNVGIGTAAPGNYKLYVNGNTWVQGSLQSSGQLKAGTSLAIGAASSGGYTLPATDGTNGYVLKTNGSGTVAWAADSSGGGSGDITGVTLSGDTGTVSDTSGNVDLTIAGGNGIVTSCSGTTLSAAISDTNVTAGSYTNTSITVNAQGQLTAASSGSSGGGSGTVTDDDATQTGHEVAVYTGEAEVGLAQKLVWNNTGEALTIGALTDQTGSGTTTKLWVDTGIICSDIKAKTGAWGLYTEAYSSHLQFTGGSFYAPSNTSGKGSYYAWGSTPDPRWINGAGTAYDIYLMSVSDYRLKKDVELWDTGSASALVKSLPVYSYKWNEVGVKRFPEQSETNRVGFIAHEVSEKTNVNNLVAEEKDRVLDDGTLIPQGINQPDMIPILWAALQDALKRIEVLEGE